jgi:ADP-heptose:LPS heptosyltransferase
VPDFEFDWIIKKEECVLKSFAKSVTRNLLRCVDNPKRLRRLGELLFRLTGFRNLASQSGTPANVAVFKLDRLGDVVLCSQMLAGLRRAWPESRITLFVRESLVELARLCPDVDEVVGVPVDERTMLFDPDSGEYGSWKRQLVKWLIYCHRGKLRKRRFDVALVLRWDTDYYGAIPLAYLIGAPKRWGVTEIATARKAVSNRGFDQLLTNVVKGESVRHEFLLNESFLLALGLKSHGDRKLVSWVVEADRKKAADIMAAAGVVSSKLTVVLCMGAGWKSRMWPVESYAKLCGTVFDSEKVQLVTFGTAAEKGLGLQLRKMLGNTVINLEGKLPLSLLPAAVSLGVLYIGSDTGTMHLAVAAGLPVFEISCHPLDGEPYWGESPLRFGPWGVTNRIVQPEKAAAPCKKYCASGESHCILAVSIEKAAVGLRSLLEETGMRNVCIDDHECKNALSL